MSLTYNPSSSSQRPSKKRVIPTDAEWEFYKKVIIGLYIHDSMTLDQVSRVMDESYDFRPTTRGYKRRLDQWQAWKNQRRAKIARSPNLLPADIVGGILYENFHGYTARWMYEPSFDAHTHVKEDHPHDFSMINRLLVDGAVIFYKYDVSWGYAMLQAMAEKIARLSFIDVPSFLASLLSRIVYITSLRGLSNRGPQLQKDILVELLKRSCSSPHAPRKKAGRLESLIRNLDKLGDHITEQPEVLRQMVFRINPQTSSTPIFVELWRHPSYVQLHEGGGSVRQERLRTGNRSQVTRECGHDGEGTWSKAQQRSASVFPDEEEVDSSLMKWSLDCDNGGCSSTVTPVGTSKSELARSVRSRTAHIEAAEREAKAGRLDVAREEIVQALGVTDTAWEYWSPESLRVLAGWAAVLRELGHVDEWEAVTMDMENRLSVLLEKLELDQSLIAFVREYGAAADVSRTDWQGLNVS